MNDQAIQAVLNASLKAEARRKEHLQQIETLQAQVTILKELLADSLTAIEQKFESDEAEFDFEQMAGYVCAASYLERKFGRPSLVRRFREQMEKLTF